MIKYNLYCNFYETVQILVMIYYYLFWILPNDIRDHKKNNLVDIIPYGIAIQNINTNNWKYCNSSLLQLLKVDSVLSAYEKMESFKNNLTSNLSSSQSSMKGGKANFDNQLYNDSICCVIEDLTLSKSL